MGLWVAQSLVFCVVFRLPLFCLLLSPPSPCELSERKVTSPSNLKVEGALDNYSLVFVTFINFFGQDPSDVTLPTFSK
jgi:hypothetical protein